MRVAYLRQSLISQNTFTGEAIIIRNKPWFHPQVVQYEQQCERKALMRSVYRWSVTLYQSSTEYKMSVWASRGEPASPRWINGSTSLTSEEINTLLWQNLNLQGRQKAEALLHAARGDTFNEWVHCFQLPPATKSIAWDSDEMAVIDQAPTKQTRF